jgi:hypothetical protein
VRVFRVRVHNNRRRRDESSDAIESSTIILKNLLKNKIDIERHHIKLIIKIIELNNNVNSSKKVNNLYPPTNIASFIKILSPKNKYEFINA